MCNNCISIPLSHETFDVYLEYVMLLVLDKYNLVTFFFPFVFSLFFVLFLLLFYFLFSVYATF